MAGDRIEGEGVDGRPWEVVVGPHVTSYAPGVAALLEVEGPTFIDSQDAARIAVFLLDAAKVDIVGAARRVIEAHQRYKEAEEATHAWAAYEKAAADRHDALDVFASELAKLDALVGHDMSEARQEK